jgi:hypothetical protein
VATMYRQLFRTRVLQQRSNPTRCLAVAEAVVQSWLPAADLLLLFQEISDGSDAIDSEDQVSLLGGLVQSFSYG